MDIKIELLEPQNRNEKLIQEFSEKARRFYEENMEAGAQAVSYHQELQRISASSNHREIRALAGGLLEVGFDFDLLRGMIKGGALGWAKMQILWIDQKPFFTGNLFIQTKDFDDPIMKLTQEDLDETLLHESLHYFTSIVFEAYKKLKEMDKMDLFAKYFTKVDLDFCIEVFGLHQKYQASGGCLNVHEFLAYGLTSTEKRGAMNPGTAQDLKKISLSANESAYDRLLASYLKFYKEVPLSRHKLLCNSKGDLDQELREMIAEAKQVREG